MQKLLIVLAVGLLAVGCGGKPALRDSVVGEYVWNFRANVRMENMAGQSIRKEVEGAIIEVYLENGVMYRYGDHPFLERDTNKLEKISTNIMRKATRREEFKWSISNGEIHVVNDSGFIEVYRYNKDKSINSIADIDEDGKRTDYSKGSQRTLKKIK